MEFYVQGREEGEKREREKVRRRNEGKNEEEEKGFVVTEGKKRKDTVCVVSGQATALAHTQSRQERKRSGRDAAVVHTAPND